MLSAVLPTEEGNVIHVRFYETEGRDDTVTFRFAKAPAGTQSVDLRGREVPSDVTVRGNEVRVTAKAASLGQIRVTF